jgi:hypothetical protein
LNNEVIEKTCSSLIERVANEMERLSKLKTIDENKLDKTLFSLEEEPERMDIELLDENLSDLNSDLKTNKLDSMHSNNQNQSENENENNDIDEQMERIVIEEFSKCLINLIEKAEKRKIY